MLARFLIRGHHFTASGDVGQVSVYDHRGQCVVSGLHSATAAEAWCARRCANMPEKLPFQRPAPQIGRSRVTGY